jgi:hypothetical protein
LVSKIRSKFISNERPDPAGSGLLILHSQTKLLALCIKRKSAMLAEVLKQAAIV